MATGTGSFQQVMELHHGDCLDILPTIADNSVDLVLTDPPYGTTRCKWDSVIPLEPMWEQLKRVIKHNGAIVMTAAQPFTTTLIASNLKHFKYQWVWDKGQGTGFLNAANQPLRSCEDVLVFYQSQPRYMPQMRIGFKPYKRHRTGLSNTQNYGSQTASTSESDGTRYPLNLIHFSKDASSQHPTQKPVALMEYLIKTYTLPGETVLDFTMGSGTTGVACHNTGRKFIGIEKDADYFQLAKDRIEQAQRQLNLFTDEVAV